MNLRYFLVLLALCVALPGCCWCRHHHHCCKPIYEPLPAGPPAPLVEKMP